MPGAPARRVLAGVALVAGCTLAAQVLLTRLFSAVLFYHFAFLAISLALLGAGAGALAVYLRPAWFERRPTEEVLARWSALLALLLAAAPLVLVRLDYPDQFQVNAQLVFTLAIASLVSALPFVAAGTAIALAIKHYVASVGRVYAFDLAGAGLGAVAIVPLLGLVAAPTLLVGLALVAAVAALLFGWGAAGARKLAAGAAALAALLVLLAGTTDLYYLEAPFETRLDRAPISDRWTAISRVVGHGGQGENAAVTYDQDFAPVPRRAPDAPPPDWRTLDLGPQSIGYELTGPGHGLVIGGGGGRDIYNALSSGFERVDVIELNGAIRKTVDTELGSWSGRPYSQPGVSVAIGDGRSKLAGRDTHYDQIHIGFTNTLTANLGAAYALSENHLYTVEAFDEYLDHLKPGGVLNVSRPYRFAGEEALRTTVLALESLRRRGIEQPERHVVTILGGRRAGLFFGTTLTKLEPYTDAELATIRRLAAERNGAGRDGGLVFAPGGPNLREWGQLAAAPSAEAFCEDYRADVCAPTDDRPFFLNATRLGDLFESAPPGATFLSRTPFFVLLAALGILLVLSLAAFVLPLALVRGSRRPPPSALLFFAAIGVGFLVLEVVLIQRFVLFLGFPTYALSVVLSSLLIATGIGSLLSGRLRDPRAGLTRALIAALVLITAAAFALEPLLEALIGLPLAARMVVSAVLLAPVGLCLGMAMPLGLARLAGLHPEGVAWAWAINGLTSVLASVLALVVAITVGFTATTLLALACYAAALLHVRLGRWPDAGAGEPPRPAQPAEVAA
jgi:hypothetical protein